MTLKPVLEHAPQFTVVAAALTIVYMVLSGHVPVSATTQTRGGGVGMTETPELLRHQFAAIQASIDAAARRSDENYLSLLERFAEQRGAMREMSEQTRQSIVSLEAKIDPVVRKVEGLELRVGALERTQADINARVGKNEERP